MTSKYVGRTFNNPSLGPAVTPHSFSLGTVSYRPGGQGGIDLCDACLDICESQPTIKGYTNCVSKCATLGYCGKPHPVVRS